MSATLIIGNGAIGQLLFEGIAASGQQVFLHGRAGLDRCAGGESGTQTLVIFATRCGALRDAYDQHLANLDPAAPVLIAMNGMPEAQGNIPADGAIVLAVGARRNDQGPVRFVVANTSVIVPTREPFGPQLLALLQKLAGDMTSYGVPMKVLNDVSAGRDLRLRKIALNSIANGISAVTRQTMGQIAFDRVLRPMVRALVDEFNLVAELAETRYRLTDREALRFLRAGRTHLPSSAAAIARGGDHELQAINGYLLEIAAGHGLTLPVNGLLLRLAMLADPLRLPSSELALLARFARSHRTAKSTLTLAS